MAVGGLLALAAGMPHGHATFMQTKFEDLRCGFAAQFAWTFPATDINPTIERVGPNKNWSVRLIMDLTNPGPPVKRRLLAFPQHDPGTNPCDAGHGPNKLDGFLSFNDLERPKKGTTTVARVDKVAHDAHFDYFIGVLKLPSEGNATVKIFGQHKGAENPVSASFHNFSDEPLNGFFQGSYGSPDAKDRGPSIPFLGNPLPPGQVARRTLPKKDGKEPTDFFVGVSGSALTETELAFPGVGHGLPGTAELELAPMIQMLAPGGFLVPMLRDPEKTQDLFVYVDLLQWLGAEGTFTPLAEYDIVDGTNELLPGYFVSTTPITFDADGFPGGTAYTGHAFAAGGIDGELVPVPSTFWLFAAGCAAIVSTRLGRSRSTPMSR